MSMLTMQVDSLRKHAERLRQLANGAVNQGFPARQDLYESAAEMRKAADTILSLRDKLQPVPAELDYIEDKSRWAELFGTPELAARTLYYDKEPICAGCALMDKCEKTPDEEHDTCFLSDYDALLGWLRGDA